MKVTTYLDYMSWTGGFICGGFLRRAADHVAKDTKASERPHVPFLRDLEIRTFRILDQNALNQWREDRGAHIDHINATLGDDPDPCLPISGSVALLAQVIKYGPELAGSVLGAAIGIAAIPLAFPYLALTGERKIKIDHYTGIETKPNAETILGGAIRSLFERSGP